MPQQHPFNIFGQEARCQNHRTSCNCTGVLPLDSSGRIQQWYLDRLQSVLARFDDVLHPDAYTVNHYRAAFAILEKNLADERQQVEAAAEAARVKAIEETVEAARWSKRIVRWSKRIVCFVVGAFSWLKAQRW